MDKLMASSRMNTSSNDYKQKTKETKNLEETMECKLEVAQSIDVEKSVQDIKNIRKKQKEEQEKNSLQSFLLQMRVGRQRQKVSNALDYSPSKDLIKIGSADSVAMVNNIAANIRIKMGKVRRSGANPEQIALVLGKMSGVIGKARIKASKLRQEMQIEQCKEQARIQKQELEEEKLERELRRKKKNRMSQETNDIMEAKKTETTGGNSGFEGLYNSSVGDTSKVITPIIQTPPTAVDIISTSEVGISESTTALDVTL